MPSPVVIFGKGYLGHRFAAALPGSELVGTDITDAEAVARVLDRIKPSSVLNAAGKTGTPNVDWCESHPVETYRSNVIGALRLAEAALARGTHLCHIGSGCIFYGPCPYRSGGWREEDPANPSGFYSRTKYAADLVLSKLPNVCVARIRMPIDSAPHPRNLITKLAKYSKVIDVENSVTVVEDLITAVQALLERRAEGVFHVTNPGVMRHRDLLALYREHVDRTHEVELIPEEALVSTGLAVKARSNAILESPRLEALGIRLRPIDVALRSAMIEYARGSRQ
jgi:dTDP-4-dehydrorhamnose reductase